MNKNGKWIWYEIIMDMHTHYLGALYEYYYQKNYYYKSIIQLYSSDLALENILCASNEL